MANFIFDPERPVKPLPHRIAIWEIGQRAHDCMMAENFPHPEATFPHDAEGQIWLRCYPVELLYPDHAT
jgi:hypothetical protein